MIKITRPPKPDFMSVAGNKWDTETQAAILHFSQVPVVGDFEFDAYNDPRVKEALRLVFVKCAYCESAYSNTSDGDIEHFRPKGRVSEKNPQTPGYYWLANDWDNLLLSCQHCNQRRKHLIEGVAAKQGVGKLDQFPLSDDSRRLHNHTMPIANEEQVRLLLNPCTGGDDPEDHFNYEKTRCIMVPLTEKGKSSIRVYALSRTFLVEERQKRMLFVFKQIDVVKKSLEWYNATPSNDNKEFFDKQLENLLFYTRDEQPFAGMARFFVRRFLEENNLTP